MGGKKYNKDGSKKTTNQTAPSACGQQKPPASGASGQIMTAGVSATTETKSKPKVQQQLPLLQQRTDEPIQSQHQSQQEQISMPIEQSPSRSVSLSESTKSIASSTSSTTTTSGARGGATPKASKPIGKTDGKTPPLPQYQSTLRPITKEPGTRGGPLGLIETNYLELNISKLVDNVYKYDVEINIKIGPKKLNSAAFIAFCAKFFPNRRDISYDWKKIALTACPLDIKGELVGEVQIVHPITGKTLDCTVTIKPAQDGAMVLIKHALANYNPENIEETMQALDIILKSVYNQHLDHGIRSGRSFFFTPKDRSQYLGDFYELRKGLFQSVTLGHHPNNRQAILPLLNVDVTNKAFPKPFNSLIDLLRAMPNEYSTRNRRFPDINLNRPLSNDVAKKLHAHLAGLDLCYCSDGTKKTVRKYFELGKVPAEEIFEMEKDGKKTKISVQNYFDRELRCRIQYPNLQCIRLGNKNKYISVPMEFCAILGNQVVNKKCTDKQTAEMIRHTAVSTDQRQANIWEQVDLMQYNKSDTLNAFGIKVDDKKFLKVPARQLVPPEIEYSNGVATPSKGQWRMDFGRKNMKFLKAADHVKWSILNTDTYLRDNSILNSFATELYNVSRTNGWNMENRPITMKTIDSNEITEYIKSMYQKVDIIFCVIPTKNHPNYTIVKQAGELETEVLTQCVTSTTINSVLKQLSDPRTVGRAKTTLSNLLLKDNAKLNGTNHKLSTQTSPIINNFDREPVMFIGADVTHPAPGLTNGYSVAAAVASHDQNAACYNAGWRPQKGEIIADFQIFVKDALQFFYEKNKKLPSKIFYFRDGVSDSQFKQVMESEWNAMLRACAEIENGYEKRVKVTIVIVQKRHHVRFFPGQNSKISEDRNNNVPAGTVVDTTITRQDEAQYYLCSHQAIQGVARPTKYCILLDDGNHSMDDLQALTYNLCHMFARCNRSVSYPAPTYYAHLAAARGKVLLTGKNVDIENLDNYDHPEMPISKSHPMHFI